MQISSSIMNTRILGIETSCDETAAAVYHTEKGVISSVLFSQTDLHAALGGVIPELASRTQLEKITPIVEETLKQASVSLDAIDAIAVTHTPGLPGSLLVGVCFAKALAWIANKPLIGINHIEGHTFSSFLEYKVPFPHLCLTASGGHTSLHLVRDFGMYEILGKTRDDAAGEAFDKIGRMLGLPYPAGPVIEKLAREVNFVDPYHYPRGKKYVLDFSFSGLKTAVLYDLVAKGAYDLKKKEFLESNNQELIKNVASSLLVCIGDIFAEKLSYAIEQHPYIKAVTFVGGVACNQYLKTRLTSVAYDHNREFYSPSPKYCTDNAAMIAFVGGYKLKQGLLSSLELDIKP